MEAVASFGIEASNSTKYVIEVKESAMKKNRPISSTRVSSSQTKVGVKAKVSLVIAAASLAMMVVGNHSA